MPSASWSTPTPPRRWTRSCTSTSWRSAAAGRSSAPSARSGCSPRWPCTSYTGSCPPAAPTQLRLLDTTDAPASEGGWVLLGECPGEAIALGLVGRFWRPVISYATVERDDFRDFAEPGWAKTVYELSVHGLDDGRTLVTGLMRTATTDEHARRWFQRYWTLGVGSGAHVLVNGLLEQARERAEHGVAA